MIHWAMITVHNVTNILKDGTRCDDLNGHVVRHEDAPAVYAIVNQMKQAVRKENEK